MTTPVAPQSPDLDPYAGLTLDDRSAQDFIDLAFQDAASKMPGWKPLAGATEVVLIENLSLIIGELVQRLNFVPIGVIKALLSQLYQIPRSLGTPSKASALFTLADTSAHVIPAGTRVAVLIAGASFMFTTDQDLNIAAGAGQGNVGISSVDNTDQLNGLTQGTVLQLVDSVSFVQTVALATTVSGGTVAEDDNAYLNRGAQVLRRLTSTLVTPDNFTAQALAQPNIYRATSVDNYDPAVGPVGSNAGHISVACLDPNGNPLATADKTALLAILQAQAAGNLGIHVIDPTITSVAVTATLVAVKGADTNTVKDAADAALRAYLSPKTWGWAGTVRINELVSLLDQVQGVDYVASVTVPAADLALGGAAPLASYDEATSITVTAQ